ncbi:MAG: hypothetical protein AAGA01_15980 [Cyanobacteria bacterium P01_E01_bin.43]
MKSPKSHSTFQYVFATVIALTLGSGGTALHLAGQPTMTDAQSRLFDSAIATWTTGTAALVGMLSLRTQDDDDGE